MTHDQDSASPLSPTDDSLRGTFQVSPMNPWHDPSDGRFASGPMIQPLVALVADEFYNHAHDAKGKFAPHAGAATAPIRMEDLTEEKLAEILKQHQDGKTEIREGFRRQVADTMDALGYKYSDPEQRLSESMAQIDEFSKGKLKPEDRSQIESDMRDSFNGTDLYERPSHAGAVEPDRFIVEHDAHPAMVAGIAYAHEDVQKDWPLERRVPLTVTVHADSLPGGTAERPETAIAVTFSTRGAALIDYNATRMANDLHRQPADWFSAPITQMNDVRYIVNHEYAHAQDYQDMNTGNRVFSDPGGMGSASWPSPTFVRKQQEIAQSLGKYARTNAQETFAELHAQFRERGYGGYPNDDPRRIVAKELGWKEPSYIEAENRPAWAVQ